MALDVGVWGEGGWGEHSLADGQWICWTFMNLVSVIPQPTDLWCACSQSAIAWVAPGLRLPPMGLANCEPATSWGAGLLTLRPLSLRTGMRTHPARSLTRRQRSRRGGLITSLWRLMTQVR